MKHRNSLKGLIISYMIAPFVYFLLTTFVVIIIFQIRSDTIDSSRRTLPFFLQPLTAIVDGDLDRASTYSGFPGFLAVLDTQGTIYLDMIGIAQILPNQSNHSNQSQNYRDLFDRVFPIDSDSPGIVLGRFDYNNLEGIFVFDTKFLPLYMQNSIIYFFLFFIFFLSMGTSLMGHRTLKALNKTISKLISVAEQVAQGSLMVHIDQPHFRELESLVSAFTSMIQQMRQTSEQEHRFTLAISHDLKTPLTSIRGYLEAIRDGIISDPKEIQSVSSMILQKSGLLEERIQELIDYASSKDSKTSPNTELPTTIAKELAPLELLQSLSEMFKDDAQIRQRRFESTISVPDHVRILGNWNLISRALENIFDNACRYTKDHDTIRLTGSVTDSELLVTIEDSGLGVSPEDQPYIFELFYRSDKGRNERGMGIGLAMVQQVMNQLQGQVEYITSDLGGAGFQLRFPLHPSPKQ
jgi:signal transduction histidine kinase